MRRPEIKTRKEYDKRLAELSDWMANQDKPEPPQLEQLIQIIVKYEDENFPFPI